MRYLLKRQDLCDFEKKTLRNWKNDILVQNDRQQVDVWVRGSLVFETGINQQALATHSAQKASAHQR